MAPEISGRVRKLFRHSIVIDGVLRVVHNCMVDIGSLSSCLGPRLGCMEVLCRLEFQSMCLCICLSVYVCWFNLSVCFEGQYDCLELMPNEFM